MTMNEVSIEITHDCALKCIYCSSSAEHPSPIGELSLDEVKSIIDEAKKCGAKEVSLSGGEPLLHPQIFEILKYAGDMGFKILLYTSGVIFNNSEECISVSEELWKRIKDFTRENIIVIFDLQGPNSEIVDRLMGVEGAFQIIEESINNAVKCGLECQAHMVPMVPNYKYIFSVADFAELKGLKKLSFLRFVPQGRGLENVDSLLLSPKQFYELQFILLRLLNDEKLGRRKMSFRLGHPIDFLFLISTCQEIKPCRGGKDAPLVLPNGDVHMCPAWKNLKHLKAGNIREKSLSDIWENSSFYKKFRKFASDPKEKIRGKCKDCPYLIYCKAGCTAQRILYNGHDVPFPDCMYLSPDPLCPFVTGMLRGV